MEITEQAATAIAGIIGGGGFVKLASVILSHRLKSHAQPVEQWEKIAVRLEAEIATNKTQAQVEIASLRRDNERIRDDHRDCMKQHSESQLALGEMRGRVAELRELAHVAAGIKAVLPANYPVVEQPH